jgi:hypothetical protein
VCSLVDSVFEFSQIRHHSIKRRRFSKEHLPHVPVVASNLCNLLVGLLLNVLFGWWWADPVAGLVMVPVNAKEGVDGIKGKGCSECGCGIGDS